MRDLSPVDVLADLFAELLIANAQEMAEVVIRRLADAGFRIVPAGD